MNFTLIFLKIAPPPNLKNAEIGRLGFGCGGDIFKHQNGGFRFGYLYRNGDFDL